MADLSFEPICPVAKRIAAVGSAALISRYHLPAHFRQDLQQEALVELWRKRNVFDDARGSWRTFAEKVIANRLRSSLRVLRREPAGPFFAVTIQILNSTPKPRGNPDLEISIAQVLCRVAKFDRDVAESLMVRSAVETAGRLNVSRATIYRAIERLRFAFIAAGFGERRNVSASERKPAPDRGRLQ
jgi:DNA-directed RNA polymerase specialized sigma24 family protein